ncbi:hypothetical protein [Plantibacter sp. YIM 135249]|uniref:hypothetical protein n=1 Tax=Plantibacter sp. YIM 135249 TaxID=3423918 RepID=UPI003D330A0D
MRLSSLLRETLRDITSGTTRFTLFGLLLGGLICGLVFADSTLILQQVTAAHTFRNAGGATLVLSAPGQVDGQACEDLNHTSGVSAAGALRESTRKVTISALPDAPVPEYEVTLDFPQLLTNSTTLEAGVVLSDEVADALGVSAGGAIATDIGSLPIAGTFAYPADGRRPGFGYAVLSPTASRLTFDECWLASWPPITNGRALLFTTLLPGSIDPENRPTVTQLNTSLGTAFAGSTAYDSRVTRNATPVAFLLAGLIGYIAVRARRLQLASALHSGLARRDLILLQLCQTSSWALISTVIGTGTAVTMTLALSGGDAIPIFLTTAGIALAGFSGALIGAILAAICVTEKHLFRYFKDR